MDYHRCQQRLIEIENQIELGQGDGEEAVREYYEAKAEHEYQWARTYMQQEGTVEERRQKTILTLYRSEAYKRFVSAEAQYHGWKAVARTSETRASILQSLLRAHTREAQQGGEQPQWSGRRAA